VPLPSNNLAWPPPEHAALGRDMAEADAWYSGDDAKLTAFYGGAASQTPRARGGMLARAKFWARQNDATARQRVHVPAAADVAATSADLLFGDEPRITIPEAHEETADPAAKATEDRLAEIIEADGITSTLLEAAEVCAGIGGVYLRPAWDHDVADHPMLTVVHGDNALPEFAWGKLVAVTFWREVQRDGAGVVWRHLERHEPGVILHGLYAGTSDKLGVKMPLGSLPATRGLAVDDEGAVVLPDGIDGILPRYVPNVLPNRKRRGQPVGRADTAGTESLMDGLDETMTSWMRDIRLGKGRVIVPHEFLERTGGRGGGASFDLDAEVFAPLDIDPANAEKAGITPVQFDIRTQQHADTCADLFERIVTGAGYSPQTFGLNGEGGMTTATEVAAKEARSFRTTTRKQRYWSTALADAIEMLLVIDRAEFSGKAEPMRPRIDFPELGQQDIREVASTLNLLNLAQAASVETKVRLVNPDLDEGEVKAEVQRILDEQGLSPAEVPDPTGGLP
jgi:A118 family predicted phage portal protein